MRRLMTVAVTFSVLLIGIGIGHQMAGEAFAAGIPTETPLAYSGTLVDGGTPVTGSRDITVRLYSASSGGSPVCETIADSTTVTAGRFRIALHANCLAAVRADGDLWDELRVDDVALPRSKLGAVPYAVESANASTLAGMQASSFAASSHDHAGSYVPVGSTVSCTSGQKVTGINTSTGDVACAADTDTNTQLNEGQVDVFVANNGYLSSESDPSVNALGKATITCTGLNTVPKWGGSSWACGQDDDGPWSVSSGDVTYAGGEVGVGTSSPGAALDVQTNSSSHGIRVGGAADPHFQVASTGVIDTPKQSAVHARSNAGQIIGNDVATKVQLNAETVDTQNEFDTATYRFTAKQAGTYLIMAHYNENGFANANYWIYLEVRKNNVAALTGLNRAGVQGSDSVDSNGMIQLVPGDYIELWATSGGSQNGGTGRMSILKVL